MDTKTKSRAFVEKAEIFLKDFKEKLKSKLNPYQKRNTKIKVDFDKNWIDDANSTSDASVISIDIFFFSLGKREAEDGLIYFNKRGVTFVLAHEINRIDKKNPSLMPIVYYNELGILTEYPVEAKIFKLEQIGSEKTIDALANWINNGILDFNVFFK
ncbi:MAG: hypothetical protein WCO35_03550 [Candidatus Nomurabacteria bacterium]